MICCTECFNDLEIRASIEAINRKGDCPICKSKDVWIYDSDMDTDDSVIEELLISILEIYVPESRLNINCPDKSLDMIEHKLLNDWNIFNVNEKGIRIIIQDIIDNSLDIDSRILEEKVVIPQLFDTAYLRENSIMGQYSWTDFKKYLRNENRFHSKYIQLELLADILKDTEVIIPKGTLFYRARKSRKEGFGRKEMGAPPTDMATAGRANSKGISCLYLCNKKNTTVKEIRANAFDFVTIANFRLQRDVKILDLNIISHNSPFYADTDKIKFLVNDKHLKEIQDDLAKPITGDDSELDYLPTQYISDFAKYLGYDGVKYLSTFDKLSYNVALFDIEACKCTYHKNYLVGNLDYKLTVV